MSTNGSICTIPNRRILDKHFISQLVSAPVKEFRISAGSNPGDGVAGKLLAVDIKTESNEIHNLVLKSALPMTGIIDKETLLSGELTTELNVFPREIVYYKELAPIFQEVADKHSKILPLFSNPKYYAGLYNRENGLNDYIALEDLRPSGYKMADKFKALNLEQVTWVMRGLATLHSVSYGLLNGKNANQAFCDIRNDVKSDLNTHGWDKRTYPFADHDLLYNGLISKMIMLIKEMGEVEAGGRMEKFTKSGYKILLDLWEKTGIDDKYFAVLIHGDLWTNNIMYKLASDGKSVEDMKFIDFQQLRFGNIYEDLHYFIFTSTTPEFRRNYLETIMKIYFDEFHMALKEMGGCPMPNGFTLEALKKTFHENWDYGSSYNLVTIPFQLGIMPPPPSPMSPVEVNVTDKIGNGANDKFFPTSDDKEDGKSQENRKEMFNTMMDGMQEAFLGATRNSPAARKWLLELTEEMKEHEII